MATTTPSDAELQLVAPRQPVSAHLRDVWRFRELLGNLVRKELKVRYKNSTLGFVWSMLNPLFLLGVYSLVFNILGASFSYFTVWLLIGLLPWFLFNTALLGGTASITGNAGLVGKVRFPREILPLAAVGAALVHFVLQTSVLIGILLVIRMDVDWAYVWLLPLALLTLLVFGAAGAIFLGALNVYYRDTGHLLEIIMMAWFWLTPILYGYVLIGDKLTEHGMNSSLLLANPVVPAIITFQRALYGAPAVYTTTTDPATGQLVQTPSVRLLPDASSLWYLRNLGIALAVGIALFLLAIKYFDKAEGNFVESL